MLRLHAQHGGFPPKIVEYGLKYANSGFTLRSPLKSVYNTIVAAFSDCGLFFEADFYLEKMMDISRLDPCDSSVDFWNSDTLNELVYYDSKVYVKLGMGRCCRCRAGVSGYAGDSYRTGDS